MAINPSRILSHLLNTGLQNKDNPLYQVIRELIDLITSISSSIGLSGSSGSGLTDQSFVTVNNDTATLPSSRQLVAGIGISLSTTTAGQIGVFSSGSWVPLTDGDVNEPDIIVDSFGDAIVAFVP